MTALANVYLPYMVTGTLPTEISALTALAGLEFGETKWMAQYPRRSFPFKIGSFTVHDNEFTGTVQKNSVNLQVGKVVFTFGEFVISSPTELGA